MSEDICIDNRFEIIDKAQRLLIESTNITDSPDDMKALYSILYRCWQMGWLDRLDGTIADTLDENAELRKERDFYYNQVTENGERAQRAIDALNDENAKLRELVRDMWGCISHIGEYDVFYYDMAKDGCGISCTVNGEHCCADKLHYRMRELGVEV